MPTVRVNVELLERLAEVGSATVAVLTVLLLVAVLMVLASEPRLVIFTE